MIVFKGTHRNNLLNISCKNRFVRRLVQYKESHSITCLIVSVNCLFTAEYIRMSIKYSNSAFQTFRQSAFRKRNKNTDYFAQIQFDFQKDKPKNISEIKVLNHPDYQI